MYISEIMFLSLLTFSPSYSCNLHALESVKTIFSFSALWMNKIWVENIREGLGMSLDTLNSFKVKGEFCAFRV